MSFSQIQDVPAPLCESNEKWKIISHKIIKYKRNIITAETTSNKLIAQSFQFKGRVNFDVRRIKQAYNDEIPLKPANKCQHIKKYLPSINSSYRPHLKIYWKNTYLLKKKEKEKTRNDDSMEKFETANKHYFSVKYNFFLIMFNN